MDVRFQEAIKEAVAKFRSIDKNKVVRVIGHLDSDGITASSILIDTLTRDDRKFSFSIVKQLEENVLNELSNESYDIFFFVDLGAGNLKDIKEKLKDKTVFVLDHHVPQMEEGIIHVNPHLFGIDGGEEISGAGVTYLFCKEFDPSVKDISHLALIGAIGDMQCKREFLGLNKEILEDAKEKVEIKDGLRMFGSHTRPLHKLLEYSTDPYIPGITGSEERAVSFLQELGINLKEGNEWKKLINLNEEEMKKLVTGIILRRMGSEENPEDIFGFVYILKDEETDFLKDLKEFSTLLNACGRLSKPSLGVGVCLGNKEIKKKAIDVLTEYKAELIKGLNWFYGAKEKGEVTDNGKVAVINYGDHVKETMIGTITSMVANSNVYKNGTILVGLGYTLGDKIKISMRYVGRDDKVDIRNQLVEIITNVDQGAEVGGHSKACGALIEQDKEQAFIEKAMEIIK